MRYLSSESAKSFYCSWNTHVGWQWKLQQETPLLIVTVTFIANWFCCLLMDPVKGDWKISVQRMNVITSQLTFWSFVAKKASNWDQITSLYCLYVKLKLHIGLQTLMWCDHFSLLRFTYSQLNVRIKVLKMTLTMLL